MCLVSLDVGMMSEGILVVILMMARGVSLHPTKLRQVHIGGSLRLVEAVGPELSDSTTGIFTESPENEIILGRIHCVHDDHVDSSRVDGRQVVYLPGLTLYFKA